MTCAACQAHVQRALEEAPGVTRAAVNLMAGEATVVFDPRAVAPPALVNAIRETGYDADLPSPGSTEFEQQQQRERAQVQEARDLAVKAIVSLLVGAASMWLSMRFMQNEAVNWLLLAVTLFVMAWAGREIFVG